MDSSAPASTPTATAVEAHVEEAGSTADVPLPPPPRPKVARSVTVFRELLDDLSEPIPTYEELERFGLFDLADSARRLAEYRLKHPVPTPVTSFAPTTSSALSDSEAPSGTRRRRPSQPPHRHSLAVVPLAKTSQQAPPLASPSLAVRANPFNLVRKTTLRPRPSRAARSTGDVPLVPTAAPTPPNLAADPEQQAVPSRPASASRHETVKENRGPRKLRKQAPPKIAVRTDDDFLLRPLAEASNAGERPRLTVAVPATSATSGRRNSWRSGTSSFVHSPLAYESTDDDAAPRPRSPSPVASFPTSARRETLPPVERKKRDSSMSSSESVYLADNERARLSPQIERTSYRFSVGAPPSPTGSASSGSVWSRALKLGVPKGIRSGSRPSSVASFDSPVTPGEDASRSFEVLGRRPSPRPAPERSVSEDTAVVEVAPAADDQALLAASISVPNLSRIVEQPETPDKRASVNSTASARPLAHAASTDSLPPSSGVTTPAVLSASSSTTIRDGTTTPNRPALPRSRGSSNLVLASTSSSRSLAEAYANAPASAPPSQGSFPSTSSFSLARGGGGGGGGDSWHSSPSSHSRSQDSLFYSGSEMHHEDEFTGASSAQDDEDEEGDAASDTRKRSSLREDVALLQALGPAAPFVVDQGHFVHPTIGQAV